MTMSQMIKKMNSWNDVIVPAAGEVIIEQESNKIKIGDGKTTFANLPYIDGNPPESQLSIGARAFIEDHIELLDNDDYETFYSLIKTVSLAREVSKALFKAGLNPKEHLKECPRGCESIFYYEGKEDPNATIKNRVWANINAHPNSNKAQYTWITTAHNTGKYWDEYISGYDVDKRRRDQENRSYLQTWTLEEAE